MTIKRHRRLFLLAFIANVISRLLERWPLLLIAAFFISPIGPHLRFAYTYSDAFGHRSYISCSYLGARGFVTPDLAPGCPLIVFLDSREWRK